MGIYDVVNPTFYPDMKSELTKDQVAHINLVLDQVQAPLAYINLMRDKRRAVREKDFPYYMGCKLLDCKHSKEGMLMQLQRRDVIFSIFRNKKSEDYTFSSAEPIITDTIIPDPVQPVGF